MENISIQTSQNISIEQPVASVGERLVATGLDFIFISIFIILVALIGIELKAGWVLFLFMLPAIFYQLICETAMHGQSWGKQIMKIKVVGADGTQAGFTGYLVRWVFRLIDVAMLFGAVATIVIIANGKGQRLGDIAAGTMVIRLKERPVLAGVYSELPEDYKIRYLQVNRLNDSDISTAREVYDFVISSHRSPESLLLADKACRALASKMAISLETGNEKFLKTLILDYNKLHSR